MDDLERREAAMRQGDSTRRGELMWVMPGWNSLTAAELAEYGWARIEGVDVEALREEMRYATPHARKHSPVVRLAAAYLAAVDA